MKTQSLIIAILIVLGVAATGQDARSPKPTTSRGKPVRMALQGEKVGKAEADQTIVKAYEALGASYYGAGSRQSLTMVTWGLYRQHGESKVSGFHFYKP